MALLLPTIIYRFWITVLLGKWSEWADIALHYSNKLTLSVK